MPRNRHSTADYLLAVYSELGRFHSYKCIVFSSKCRSWQGIWRNSGSEPNTVVTPIAHIPAGKSTIRLPLFSTSSSDDPGQDSNKHIQRSWDQCEQCCHLSHYENRAPREGANLGTLVDIEEQKRN